MQIRVFSFCKSNLEAGQQGQDETCSMQFPSQEGTSLSRHLFSDRQRREKKSKSNGEVERAAHTLHGLEARSRNETDSPILEWFVEHTATLLVLFHQHANPSKTT